MKKLVKTDFIGLRVSKEDKKLIVKEAKKAKKTISDFVIDKVKNTHDVQ